jgi:hypothetical protein
MSLYEASIRVKHECPYRELSEQFPDVTEKARQEIALVVLVPTLGIALSELLLWARMIEAALWLYVLTLVFCTLLPLRLSESTPVLARQDSGSGRTTRLARVAFEVAVVAADPNGRHRSVVIRRDCRI